MTYLLRNDYDVTNWHDFDTEQEARDWAETNLLREELSSWVLIDPEGGTWCL